MKYIFTLRQSFLSYCAKHIPHTEFQPVVEYRVNGMKYPSMRRARHEARPVLEDDSLDIFPGVHGTVLSGGVQPSGLHSHQIAGQGDIHGPAAGELREPDLDDARKSQFLYMIDSYLPLNEDEEAEMSQKLKEKEQFEVNEWLSDYEVRGIEHGIEQGLLQGKRETLILLLEH